MRHIGSTPRHDLAERFQNYLIANGKKCSLESDGEATAIWIQDDDDVPFAKDAWRDFQTQPDAPQYVEAKSQADDVLREAAARQKAARRNTVNLSRRWSQGGNAQTPVTVSVLVVCVCVFAETYLMKDSQGWEPLLFFSTDGTWRDILDGEWWRMLTPAIMHGGPLHILFNLMWWWDLGRMIEYRKGSPYLLIMTLAIAAISNALQFQFGGPWFLGLSGVVFGLFGYTWIKGKLDPADGIGISDQSAMWVMLWFIICLTGAAGAIANWAHWGGLVVGLSWGTASIVWRRWRGAV